MIKESDYDLMNWSIKKIAEVKPDKYSNLSVINIIGTKDRIIRQWSNDSTYVIKGGSHFMVYDQSKQITEVLNTIINEHSLKG